ncbi:MAG: 7TM diverse intracellular signaling domain-containing protein [Turneriella sp.]
MFPRPITLRLLLLFTPFTFAAAETPDVTVKLQKGSYNLSQKLAVYRDATGILTVAGAEKAAFTPNKIPGNAINFGYTRDNVWVKFNAINTGPHTVWYLRLGALLDRVSLFELQNGKWSERTLGRFEPFGQREVAHRDLIFRLTPSAGVQTYYLKFQSQGNVTVELDLVDLETFSAGDHDTQFAFGIYFGIMFIMVGYNLFLFLATRDQAYLWYVCYAFTFTLLHLSINGYIAEYAFPRQQPLPPLFTPLFISVSGFFSVLFTRKIIGLDTVTGFMNHLSRALALLFAGSILTAFVAPYTIAVRTATFTTLISIFGLTYCGVVRLMHGQRSARYFLLGWGALYTGIASMLLRNLGVLPHNFFTAYAMQIFSAAEVMLFSLALGDRFNQLREDSLKLQEVRRELDIARKMQLALVPPVNINSPQVDIAHRYIPMLEVGGDFMDIRVTEDGTSFFIGDVSGHGIAAAMIATTMKLSLDTEGEKHLSPAARLTHLNDNVDELPDSAFVTACSAHFSPQSGDLTMSSAGHPPVIIYHAANGSCTRYKPRGMPLGVAGASDEYTIEHAVLAPQDIVLLYTDGVIEQGAGAGNEFGLDRVEKMLVDNADKSAQEIAELLLNGIEIFSGRKRTEGFDDDVAFVIMKIAVGMPT